MTHPSGSPILVRAVTPRDLPLITNSWLTNYRKGYFVKGVPNPIYFRLHHKILETLIPRATTIIACDPEDPDVIYGWACAEVIDERLVFHYVYVKGGFKAQQTGVDESGDRTYKGWGVGSLLVQEFLKFEDNLKGIVYTHETIAGRKFGKKLYRKGVLPFEPVYNPYLLMMTLPEDWYK